MSKPIHPYLDLPLSSYWARGVARLKLEDIDPVVGNGFRIERHQKVATAGSCFAQHIARYLKNSGFNYYVAEEGHPIATKENLDTYNYGTFSARYGNIYTVRQLLQLYKRAFGLIPVSDEVWREKNGGWLDPMRPLIQPSGFRSLEEMRLDRSQHLENVKKMFVEMEFFIFTLGLTESWIDAESGTVYPMCPGVAGGSFQEGKHQFKNFSVSEVVADIDELLILLKKINSNIKIILTVSPVPLVATATKNHVINATSYSKSVLRVAAQELADKNKEIMYFPSYEIITGNFTRGKYFSEDLRSVTEEGVEHVMKVFMRHFTDGPEITTSKSKGVDREKIKAFELENAKAAQVVCDEAKYDDET
jgi:hypothetical protein